MNRNIWNRNVKNIVRSEFISVFKNRRLGSFYDIPGVGCLSPLEALNQDAVRHDADFWWAERDHESAIDIAKTLPLIGLKTIHDNFGDALSMYPDSPIELVNLDLMCQLSEDIVSYLRYFPFADDSGFSITIHHPRTRKPSDFLIASKRWFGGKKFEECFDGKTEKLKPHNIPGRVRRYNISNDSYVNTIYGLLSTVSFCEYDVRLEKIMIYGDDYIENNMVTFVFSGITKRLGTNAGYKAHATKILKAIRKLM